MCKIAINPSFYCPRHVDKRKISFIRSQVKQTGRQVSYEKSSLSQKSCSYQLWSFTFPANQPSLHPASTFSTKEYKPNFQHDIFSVSHRVELSKCNSPHCCWRRWVNTQNKSKTKLVSSWNCASTCSSHPIRCWRLKLAKAIQRI